MELIQEKPLLSFNLTHTWLRCPCISANGHPHPILRPRQPFRLVLPSMNPPTCLNLYLHLHLHLHLRLRKCLVPWPPNPRPSHSTHANTHTHTHTHAHAHAYANIPRPCNNAHAMPRSQSPCLKCMLPSYHRPPAKYPARPRSQGSRMEKKR